MGIKLDGRVRFTMNGCGITLGYDEAEEVLRSLREALNAYDAAVREREKERLYFDLHDEARQQFDERDDDFSDRG